VASSLLDALNQALDGKLIVLSGNPAKFWSIWPDAVAAAGLSWNRAYEPWRITRDAAIKAQCAARGLAVESHNGSLLWEPWEVLKNDGTPYKVFTPYYRRGCLAATPPRRPLPVPPNLVIADAIGFANGQSAIDALGLLPERDWKDGLGWRFGILARRQRMTGFTPFLMMVLMVTRMAVISRKTQCIAAIGLFALGRDFAKCRLVCCQRSHGRRHWAGS
jgi:deoxyribodipyrimidine photo-lyase